MHDSLGGSCSGTPVIQLHRDQWHTFTALRQQHQSNAGTYSVVATLSNISWYGQATATLTVNKATTATLTLLTADLNRTYDGTAKAVGFTVTPTTIASSVTVLTPAFPPPSTPSLTTAADGRGELLGRATLKNANYTAITKCDRHAGHQPGLIVTTLTLGDLSATYDGNQHAVSVTTDPAGQVANVTFLYSGSAPTEYAAFDVPPTDAGSYNVVGTLNAARYKGSARPIW